MSYNCNNYIGKSMKGRTKFPREDNFDQNYHNYDHYQYSYVSRPVKSPSPDKRSSNIITSTKSPEIYEAKRQGTPNKEEYGSIRLSQKSQVKQKHFGVISTPSHRKQIAPASFKNVDTGVSNKKGDDKQMSVAEYKINSSPSTKGRNIKIEIAADNPTDQFQIRHSSSRYRPEFRGQLSELDYLKILKSKQQHIRELKQIIQNLQQNHQVNRRSEIDDSTIRSFENKINNLNGEIKQLKVQNQYLLSALQKSKPALSSNKQQILQRQIRQLRQSLRDKQCQIQQVTSSLSKKLQKQRIDMRILQNQNQSLVRLLKQKKQKDDSQRPKDDTLAHSTLSVNQSNIIKNNQKQKLSLIKIKQIHQENIKIAQQSFYNQIKVMQQGFFNQIDELNQRVQQLNQRVNNLQNFKRQAEMKLQQRDRGDRTGQQMHRQKQRHQQIQSVLLQKYSYYQTQIQELKRQNDKLINELNKSYKINEQLQQKSLTYSRDISYLDEDAMANLRKQNQQLTKTIQQLQNQLQKNQITINKISNQKDQQIKLLENKLQFLIQEYQSKIKIQRTQSQQKLKELQQQLSQRSQRQQQLIEGHEKDKIEIEKQLKNALKLYDLENTGLRQEITKKNGQIITLTQQLQRSKIELAQISQTQRRSQAQYKKILQQNDFLKNQVTVLDKNVELIDLQLQQANNNLEQQAGKNKQLQNENKQLIDRLQSYKDLQSINENLLRQKTNLQIDRAIAYKSAQDNLQLLNLSRDRQSELLKDVVNKQNENNLVYKRMKQVQQIIINIQRQKDELKILLERTRLQRSSLRYETIEQQLKQLRQMINDYYSKNKNRLDNQIVQQYYRLNHAHELKIDENLKLMKQIDELKIQISSEVRQRLLLTQKISLLQNNISIYQRQLKERKQLYQQILQQKYRIQKEILLSKKIKAEQSNLVENFKVSTLEITGKIDRLVEFQRQRCKQINSLAVSTIIVQK